MEIEFMKRLPAKAECTGEEPFKPSKEEKLYPWLSLGKLPWFVPSMDVNLDATIQPWATGFTLTAGYPSKWTTPVALLTGGIGSAFLSGGLRREEAVVIRAEHIKRVIRAVERCGDWPWKTDKDVADQLTRVVYLVSAESHGHLYAHVFSLKRPWHYCVRNRTFSQYREEQTTLDQIVHKAVHADTAVCADTEVHSDTVVHADRMAPTASERKCPACGRLLRTSQAEFMIGNSEYQQWCREGYCSLACYDNTGVTQPTDDEAPKELLHATRQHLLHLLSERRERQLKEQSDSQRGTVCTPVLLDGPAHVRDTDSTLTNPTDSCPMSWMEYAEAVKRAVASGMPLINDPVINDVNREVVCGHCEKTMKCCDVGRVGVVEEKAIVLVCDKCGTPWGKVSL